MVKNTFRFQVSGSRLWNFKPEGLHGWDLCRFLCVALALFLWFASKASAEEPPLLSLEVQDTTLKWQDEFVLTLSIYTPADMELPPVTVDGLDQFKMQGIGKNLLQIPRGKTKRWILTYTLVASETGSFKIGPAILMVNGQAYRSNIVFLTVEGPEPRNSTVRPPSKLIPVPKIEEPPQPKEEEQKQAEPPKKEEKKAASVPAPKEDKATQKEEKKPAAVPPAKKGEKSPQAQQKEVTKPAGPPAQEEKKAETSRPTQQEKAPPPKPEAEQAAPAPKPAVQPPTVLSSAQIGDRIVIIMDTPKTRPYRYQGIPVTVRLLSQLPVENLQFLEEADFPGFLRYDFPFTSKPKGEVVSFRNDYYASFELVKFLLFPLRAGKIDIPAVRCELKVRVPSGAFPDADLRTTVQRSSNALELQVKTTPEGAVVGDFALRNEIVSDERDSKVLRITLDGNGQLSTFEFPEIPGTNFLVRKFNSSTNVKMEGDRLISKKTQDLEILPQSGAIDVVIPPLQIAEFDPDTSQLSHLKLPALSLKFAPPGTAKKSRPQLPQTGASFAGTGILIALILSAAFLYLRNIRPPRVQKHLKFKRLFSSKNLKLHISRSAARKLYQQIAIQIASKDGDSTTLMETVRRHVPQEEWLPIDRGLRKLERTAYSSTTPPAITYEEMKRICEKLETLWIP
jgi:hypothetical protein